VLVRPADYGVVLEELGRDGQLSDATRLGLARAAFAHTAAYDAAIVEWLDSIGQGVGTAEEDGADDAYPRPSISPWSVRSPFATARTRTSAVPATG